MRIREDALDVLSDLPRWAMTSGQWQQVAMILDSMTAAMAADDLPALDLTTAELELLSPVRAYPVPEIPRCQPPHEVWERVANLAQQLGGRPT